MDTRRTPLRKIGIILFAILGGLATAVVCAFAGGLLGVAAAAGLARGEYATWAPLMGAFYGFIAGIVVGMLVGWKVIADRFGIARKTKLRVALAIVIVVPAVEYTLAQWPAMVGPAASTGTMNIEAISNDGGVVILSNSRPDSSLLYRLDTHTGKLTRLTTARDRFEMGAGLSPDDKQVVFISEHRPNPSDSSESLTQIMLCDLDGSNLRPLLPEDNTDYAPSFSHDGQLVYFARHASHERYATEFELYSVKADGTDVKQVTHRRFNSDRNANLFYPESFSSDETQVLMKVETGNGSQIVIYPLRDDTRPPIVISPRIPNSPLHPQIDHTYLAAGQPRIIFMAASQGEKGFDYDLYSLEIASQGIEKLTATKHYATDFVLSSNGQKAAYIVWMGSSWLNAQPLKPALQILDMQTRAASVTELPEIKDRR